MPTKKLPGQEITLEQQLANQALYQRRLRIEHVNSNVKRCRIVKEVYTGYHGTARAVAAPTALCHDTVRPL